MLAKSVVNFIVLGKTIVCTAMEKVLTNDCEDIIDDLGPCYHEEADTRLFSCKALFAKRTFDIPHKNG